MCLKAFNNILLPHYNELSAVRKNSRLPNFQNLGILLKTLLIVNILVMLAAVLLSPNLADFLPTLAQFSVLVQPILLMTLLVLYVASPQLAQLNYAKGAAGILVLATGFGYLIAQGLNSWTFFDSVNVWRTCLFALISTAIVLYYFYLHQRAYSPAIAEARLQALQARIRPHFLFNSINAVLSLIRSQPKRAETALEDMADLFRVLMADNRDLVPISQEIALCRQYLALEQLRLEDRLKVTWRLDEMPPDTQIPPLLLQPLIENSVYHGIEPMENGGEILIHIYNKNKDLHIEISNPYTPDSTHQTGNKMALKNIQERLKLHFDLEASLQSSTQNNRYYVHIKLPIVTHA